MPGLILCLVLAGYAEAQSPPGGPLPVAGSEAPPGWSFDPPSAWAEGPSAMGSHASLFAPPGEVACGPMEGYPPAVMGPPPEVEVREPVTCLGLRHSSTHGRNVGRGWPLTGTSWLNRPYFAGGSLGTLWMTRRVENSVGRDIDTFGDVFFGWDWDHYWGSELNIGWATPELVNSQQPDALRSDRMSFWSYSHLYYPWGDALVRPYWRAGIGTTEVSFPNDDGTGRHEILLTFPLGLGVKYPLRRWLVARIEMTDYLALGESGVATQNNLTLTFALECRCGVHPRSYWPWNPSRHIW